MQNDLKPCPFCGKGDAGTVWHHGYWSVQCSYFAKDNYPNRCNQDWGEFDTEKEAAEAWNRRSEPENKPLIHCQDCIYRGGNGQTACNIYCMGSFTDDSYCSMGTDRKPEG